MFQLKQNHDDLASTIGSVAQANQHSAVGSIHQGTHHTPSEITMGTTLDDLRMVIQEEFQQSITNCPPIKQIQPPPSIQTAPTTDTTTHTNKKTRNLAAEEKRKAEGFPPCNFWCWTCGANIRHNSLDCPRKKCGHQDAATCDNPVGGDTKRDKHWGKFNNPDPSGIDERICDNPCEE